MTSSELSPNPTISPDLMKRLWLSVSQWSFCSASPHRLPFLVEGVNKGAMGKRPLSVDGRITFTQPSDWALATINLQEAYWLRWIVTDATAISTVAQVTNEHSTLRATTYRRALTRSNSETCIRMSRFFTCNVWLTFPVGKVCWNFFRKTFPPNFTVFRI